MIGAALALTLAASTPEPSMVERVCAQKASIARTVMEGRQEGFPVEEALEIARTAPEVAREYWREQVLAAYDLPRYSSAQYQRRAVEDFGNEAFMDCMRR